MGPQPVTPAAPGVSETQPTCASANGSVTVTSPIGSDYEYSNNGGASYQSTTTFTVAHDAPYSITVRKISSTCFSLAKTGTMGPQPVTPAAPGVSETQPTCANANGSVTVTSPIGSDYEYSNNGGASYQSTTTFTVAHDAPYSITVRKISSTCFSLAKTGTMGPQPVTPAAPGVSETQPTCANANGSVTVTSPIGSDYEYSNNGGASYQSTTTFTVAHDAPYSITVRKISSTCFSLAKTGTMGPQPVTPAAPGVSETQPTCASANGSVTVTSPIGSDYEYSNNGGASYQSTTTFTVAHDAPYSITVRKISSTCFSLAKTGTMGPQPVTPAAPGVSETQPTCASANGSVTVTSPIGSDYEYSNNGGASYQSTTTFTVAHDAPYSITVRKISSTCFSLAKTGTMGPQPVTPAAPGVSETQPTCANANGSVTVTSPIGSDYEYSNNGGASYQSTTTFTVAHDAPYSITVRKISSTCFSLAKTGTMGPQPVTPAAPGVSETQPTCASANGSVTVTSPIGSDYEYSNNGGASYQSTTTFTVAHDAPYSIIVRKISSTCFSLAKTGTMGPQPVTPAAPGVSETQPTCASANGSVTVTSPIGSDYEYSNNGGASYQSTTTFTVAHDAPYSIIVRKISSTCFSLAKTGTMGPQPVTPAAPGVSETQPTCASANGSVTVTSPIGSDYEYSNNGGASYQSTTTFTVAHDAPYSIIVRKISSTCFSLAKTGTMGPQPVTPAAPGVSETQPTCASANGSVTVTSPIGSDYEYSNNGGASYQSTTTFTVAHDAPYSIIVRKISSTCFSLAKTGTMGPQPVTPAAPGVSETQPTCASANGSVTVTSPIGSDYEYSNNGGASYQSTTTFTVAHDAPYSITVRKISSTCFSLAKTGTMGPQPITPAAPGVSETQPTCANANGSVTVTSPIGSDYEYSNNGGASYQSTTTFTVSHDAPYSITVRKISSTC